MLKTKYLKLNKPQFKNASDIQEIDINWEILDNDFHVLVTDIQKLKNYTKKNDLKIGSIDEKFRVVDVELNGIKERLDENERIIDEKLKGVNTDNSGLYDTINKLKDMVNNLQKQIDGLNEVPEIDNLNFILQQPEDFIQLNWPLEDLQIKGTCDVEVLYTILINGKEVFKSTNKGILLDELISSNILETNLNSGENSIKINAFSALYNMKENRFINVNLSDEIAFNYDSFNQPPVTEEISKIVSLDESHVAEILFDITLPLTSNTTGLLRIVDASWHEDVTPIDAMRLDNISHFNVGFPVMDLLDYTQNNLYQQILELTFRNSTTSKQYLKKDITLMKYPKEEIISINKISPTTDISNITDADLPMTLEYEIVGLQNYIDYSEVVVTLNGVEVKRQATGNVSLELNDTNMNIDFNTLKIDVLYKDDPSNPNDTLYYGGEGNTPMIFGYIQEIKVEIYNPLPGTLFTDVIWGDNLISSQDVDTLYIAKDDPSGDGIMYDFGYEENESKLANVGITKIQLENGVTNIGKRAFAHNGLFSVTIPNSVTSIDFAAFSGNNLTSVTIPNSVTSIGSAAFSGNNLTSVTIPNSVTSIGTSAFSKNNLESVTIPDSVTSIGTSAFEYNNLTSMTIPNSISTIEERVFGYNNLTSVIIPESVISIKSRAFWENINLNSITIPNTVISIGSVPFNNCNLTSITIGSNTDINSQNDYAYPFCSNEGFTKLYDTLGKQAGTYTWNVSSWYLEGSNTLPGTEFTDVIWGDNLISSKDGNTLYIAKDDPNGTGIMNDFFGSSNSSLLIDNGIQNVIIEDGVENVGNYAFHATNISNVTLADTITEIGRGSFKDNNISSVILPSQLTMMYYMSFANNNLLSVTIPEGVTDIDRGTFAGNYIEEVTFGTNITIWEPDENDTFNHTMSENNGTYLKNRYESNSKQAGTYAWDGSVWNQTA